MYRIPFILFVMVGVLLLASCDRLSFLQFTLTPTLIPTASPAEREAEEYAVYRTILNRNCIFNETIVGLAISQRFFPEIDPKLMENYEKYAKEIVYLYPDLDLGESIHLVSSVEWDKFFFTAEGWKSSHADFECNEINGVSRVGFSEQMGKALVYFHGQTAPEAGWEGFILLAKGNDGGWYVEKKIPVIQF